MAAQEAPHRGGIGRHPPQGGFRAPPEQRNAWPGRIGHDEIVIALKAEFAVASAQERPFDELLGRWIDNRFLDRRRFDELVSTYQLNRLLYGYESWRQVGQGWPCNWRRDGRRVPFPCHHRTARAVLQPAVLEVVLVWSDVSACVSVSKKRHGRSEQQNRDCEANSHPPCPIVGTCSLPSILSEHADPAHA